MLLLDSDTFLTPANSYYAFDICDGYWNWILRAASHGQVASIERVKRELCVKDDQIKHWVEFHGSALFLPQTAAVNNAMKEVSTWAASNGYTTAAVTGFLGKADAFLVAHAKCEGHEVVTLERSAPGSKQNIKIPDACAAHDVNCITPFEMLRRHGVRFNG